jgi:ribosomal protein S18 acetylase RimI-like enzyme
MSPSTFGAQPLVLRCSRCGRFVDWADSRLQVVDQCRPRVDLPPVLVREGTERDRPVCLEMFRSDFGHTVIFAFGEKVPLVDLPVLVAELKGELAGALAYRMTPGALQIVALATTPMWQRSGVGGHLVAEAELLAGQKGLGRVLVATSNDNLPALYFYQRRAYAISEVCPGALVGHTGQPGFAGIPVRDEVRMHKILAAR